MNLKIVFIFIDLVTKDVEYFKGYILAISILSFQSPPCSFFCPFVLGFLFAYSLDFEFFVYLDNYFCIGLSCLLKRQAMPTSSPDL